MQNLIYIQSQDIDARVIIDRGELISYVKSGEELIHQKGSPGWRNADTEMFPIIGPTDTNNFKVPTKRGEAVQDQHGILRELAYELTKRNDHEVVFKKSYVKNTPVKNSKFPEKSTVEWLSWPFNFEFKKKFQLNNSSLNIQFEIRGEDKMPYMLGYHPAFKLSGDLTEKIRLNERDILMHDVLAVGSIAYPVLETSVITLYKPKGYSILMNTKGFDNFMLWTEVPNMICIEPITAYPYTGEAVMTKDLFRNCKGTERFEVEIVPIVI